VTEITVEQVVQINKSVIKVTKSYSKDLNENHNLINSNGLESCLSGIFYRDSKGNYLNGPIPKCAGLLLYRIAESQLFENGNKRTALYSTNLFLKSNGYYFKYNKKEISDLMWGFAKPIDGSKPKFQEEDSVKQICREKNWYYS
jgi:death-on-curing family protein